MIAEIDWAGLGIFITALAGATATIIGAMRQRLNDLAKVAKSTHTLVNKNMAVQLGLNMRMAKRLFMLTKEPLDQEAADMAEAAYHEHMARQAIVDADEKEVRTGASR